MRKWKEWLMLALAPLMIAVPCLAQVVGNVTVPPTRSTGDTITATIWNSDVLGVYTYINNTLLPVLNVLTTKGDLYVYNGSALTRQAVGSDGTVLTADSTQVNGIKWASFANTTQLTTKGDLLTFGSVATRLPVGADGTVLTADSTQTDGIAWSSGGSAPSGSVVAWSPAFAGTNTVPTGWLLCDGTNGTPNLIGRFIVGSRPGGSSSPPASGGFGVETADSTGTGSATHVHSVTISGNTGSATGLVNCSSGSSIAVAGPTHTHAFTATGNCTSTTLEPADYALVYIMKS